MPGDQKNIQNAKAGADPDLTFGYNDLLEELKAEFDYPLREKGDVTPRDLADVTNLSERQCYTIMEKKVRAGELLKVMVKEKGRIRAYLVYRRKG